MLCDGLSLSVTMLRLDRPCGSYYKCKMPSITTIRELKKKKKNPEAYYLQDLEITQWTWGHTERLRVERMHTWVGGSTFIGVEDGRLGFVVSLLISKFHI